MGIRIKNKAARIKVTEQKLIEDYSVPIKRKTLNYWLKMKNYKFKKVLHR